MPSKNYGAKPLVNLKTTVTALGRESENRGQGSYASGKCQGNCIFFKVRELSGNFMLCQGKTSFG